MQALEAVLQHGPIYFEQDVVPNLNDMIWSYAANDVDVERGVVQFAERQAVRHDRHGAWRRRSTTRLEISEEREGSQPYRSIEFL